MKHGSSGGNPAECALAAGARHAGGACFLTALLCAAPAAAQDTTGVREAGTWVSSGPLQLGVRAPATAARSDILRRELFATGESAPPSPADDALLAAVLRAQADAVRSAVAAGASPNGRDRASRTLLLLATRNGAAPLVRALLDAGADPNVKSDGTLPLVAAVRANRWDICRLLVRAGARVDAKDDAGTPAINTAAALGFTRIVADLADAGAALDQRSREGWPPLVMAARGGHVDAAIALLDRGADVNAAGKDSFAPLYWAVYRRDTAMAALLVKRGAEVGTLSVESLQ